MSSRLHIDLERALGDADGAHAVMDAARPEAALRDLEAAAFAEDHVLDRHLHVLELDFAVTVRRVVIAEHRQHAHDRRRRAHRARRGSATAALWRSPSRIGLAHDDHDLAARIADARRPPFAAVDDVVVALALDAGGDVRRVRRRDRRLGHQERGADFAGEQRLQPLVLLIGRCRSAPALPCCRCRARSS